MPGLLDLPIELRLAIFKDAFDQEDECALTHPLLHVCRITRLEYIGVISGTFFLSIVGVPGATTKTLDPDLARLLSPMHAAMLNSLCSPKFSIIRNKDGILLHPKKKRMDLFALGNSPYAWLMEHASGALVRPVNDLDDRQYRQDLWIPTRLNYIIGFEPEFRIQPFFETGLLTEACMIELRSKENEMLEIAQTELGIWRAGRYDEEASKPASQTCETSDDMQRRWLLTFMKKFDGDGVKQKMVDALRRAAKANTRR